MKTKTIVAMGILALLMLSGFASLASALKVSLVETSPQEVAPGNRIDVTIEVENNLERGVEDVQVSLGLTSVSGEIPLSPIDSSVKSIDEMEKGEDKRVRFGLVADGDAKAGAYKIPVTMSYLVRDDVQRTTKTFTISVTINSKPNLVVDVESVLLKNRKNKVNIRITNTGLSKTKLLEVELQPSGSYEVLSSNKVYIGDLDSDDFDTASFDIFLKDKASVVVPVVLRYRDSVNKQYAETEEISLRVYSEEEAIERGLISKSNTMLYLGIFIGIFVLWLIYRRWKRRRKRKKAGGGKW